MRRQTLVSWLAFPSFALYLKAQVSASKNVAVCQSSCTEASVNQISCPACCKLSHALLAPVCRKQTFILLLLWSWNIFGHTCNFQRSKVYGSEMVPYPVFP